MYSNCRTRERARQQHCYPVNIPIVAAAGHSRVTNDYTYVLLGGIRRVGRPLTQTVYIHCICLELTDKSDK
jgi:hypothetical protein